MLQTNVSHNQGALEKSLFHVMNDQFIHHYMISVAELT